MKKNSLPLGLILGLLAPLIGFLLFKTVKFKPLSLQEMVQYMVNEPGFRTLTVAMSLSLLANAVLFTLYINRHLDNTGKGIFITTCIYGVTILLIKFLG